MSTVSRSHEAVLSEMRDFQIFTRRRSWSFVEYCKHFVARLNDVLAFGYNSAASERIWMKFGELREYCSELSLTNFGRDLRRSGSGSASRNFVFFFCPLNNARFHRLPVGQISRNLHKKTCFRVRMWGFGKHLWKFARKGSLSPKNLYYGMIKVNDFRIPAAISPKRLQILQSWQVGTPVQCWLSIDTVGMNSKWFPWHVTPAHGEQFFPQKYSSTASMGDDFTACCISRTRENLKT